jgi:hypothetical protein
MGWDVSEKIEAMVGRKIESVTLDKDKDLITFRFQDGHEQSFGVEGDCCSHSWIEHLERPLGLEGATLTGHESGGTVDATDDDKENPKQEGSEYRTHECLQVYQDVFHTDRGDIVLEYRNSSNGYYGGSLVTA